MIPGISHAEEEEEYAERVPRHKEISKENTDSPDENTQTQETSNQSAEATDSIRSASIESEPEETEASSIESNNTSSIPVLRNTDFTFTRISDHEIQLNIVSAEEKLPESFYAAISRSNNACEDKSSPLVIFQDTATKAQLEAGISFVDDLGIHTTDSYRYTYTVYDSQLMETALFTAEIPASTILVCVDPGHTYGENVMNGGEHWYCEGEFSMWIGDALMESLKEIYGISSYSTRDPALGGQYDYAISPRGSYAAGSDLFIALHTNANNDNANGYPTLDQPVEITKTLVLANVPIRNSEVGRDICNSVGQSVTDVNYSYGLSTSAVFDPAAGPECPEWTDIFNDSLGVNGTVMQRMDGSQDYYGVLLGSASVGVMGMIVEHGYHTVDKMRELAYESDLAQAYGKADAEGIAKGFKIKS